MKIKNILYYGDSLTWGYDADNITRYPFEQRWTGFLQQRLGENYRIIEEGLNGRYRNGSKSLPLLLESHAPLDLVVLLLGTNDIKDTLWLHFLKMQKLSQKTSLAIIVKLLIFLKLTFWIRAYS